VGRDGFFQQIFVSLSASIGSAQHGAGVRGRKTQRARASEETLAISGSRRIDAGISIIAKLRA